MKKKKTLAIILAFALVAITAVLVVLILKYKPDVRFKEQQQYEAYETVAYSQLVDEMVNCSLDSDKIVDTTKLGQQEIIISFRSYFLYEKEFAVTINIIDSKPPQIEGTTGRIVPLGSDVSTLYENLTIQDNVDGKNVTISIEPQVDLTKPGKQTFNYIATDSSGNVATREGYVIVEIAGSKATYFTTDNGFLGYQKDGLTYIDGILIVNKTYSFPAYYSDGLTDEFSDAYQEMKKAASSEGIGIYIVSGFRSHGLQTELFEYYCEVEGVEQAMRGSAKPGHSEHETGLAADLNYVADSFKYTRAYQWLVENCYKYGFVLRYTENDESSTGYYYEPWHYRYVGKDLAEKLWNKGEWICIEDYFGITSVYE